MNNKVVVAGGGGDLVLVCVRDVWVLCVMVLWW
jgi:hypothetical protein